MLPGNLQYWDPCIDKDNGDGGTKSFKIVEPIHFDGPTPGAPKTDEDSTQQEVNEEIKQQEYRQEEVKQEQVRHEEIKQEENKQEEVKQVKFTQPVVS